MLKKAKEIATIISPIIAIIIFLAAYYGINALLIASLAFLILFLALLFYRDFQIIKNLKLVKVETGYIGINAKIIELRIKNGGKYPIILEKIEPKTETFYVDPNKRDKYEIKIFDACYFDNFQLNPGREIKTERFNFPHYSHFENLDFMLYFKDINNKQHYQRCRLDMTSFPYPISPLTLLDAK